MTIKSPIPEDLAALLLNGIAPQEPSHSLKARVMAKVARESGISTVRAAAEDWIAISAGVAVKVLNDDGRIRTWLARLAPNAKLPAHFHRGDEECYLLEGKVCFGDFELNVGDYQIARAGTTHGEVCTPTGCLMLIRSPSEATA